jgi:hypothetical protein
MEGKPFYNLILLIYFPGTGGVGEREITPAKIAYLT